MRQIFSHFFFFFRSVEVLFYCTFWIVYLSFAMFQQCSGTNFGFSDSKWSWLISSGADFLSLSKSNNYILPTLWGERQRKAVWVSEKILKVWTVLVMWPPSIFDYLSLFVYEIKTHKCAFRTPQGKAERQCLRLNYSIQNSRAYRRSSLRLYWSVWPI